MFLNGFFIHFKLALEFFFIAVFHVFQAVAEENMLVMYNITNFAFQLVHLTACIQLRILKLFL